MKSLRRKTDFANEHNARQIDVIEVDVENLKFG